MGPFDRNRVCTDCPSHFLIVPETYEQVYNAAADRYDYEYTPVAAALGGAIAANLEESDDFVIEIFYVAPACKTLKVDCTLACLGLEQCLDACAAAPSCNPATACSGPEACLDYCGSGGFDIPEGKCDGGGGGGGCKDAWATYCEAVTGGDPDEYAECLSFYPLAVAEGFCQVCGDDPLSCIP
jgi:hypothetical protein